MLVLFVRKTQTIEHFKKTRPATLPKYLPDFCHYMSHFLLVIANYLFAFFITLFKGI